MARLFNLQSRPLWWHMILLIAGTMGPVLIFSCAMILQLNQRERASVERRLAAAAEVMAHDLDRTIEGSQRTLLAVAESDHLKHGDLAAFYREARDILATQPSWQMLILLAPDGRQLINTSYSLDRPGETVNEPDSLQQLLATSEPTIGSLALGPRKRWAFPVRVPVKQEGQIRYILTAVIGSELLQRLVTPAIVSDEWTRTVVDARGVVAARTRQPELYVGQSISPTALMAQGHSPAGILAGVGLDGQSLLSAFHRAPQSGWSVAVTVPLEIVNTQVRRSLLTVTVVGLLLTCFSALWAWLLCRMAARDIADVAHAAASMAIEEQPEVKPSAIAEINQLGHAIQTASELISQRRHERDQHLAQATAATNSLRLLNETLERRVDEQTAEAREKTAKLRDLTLELTQAEHRERRRVAQVLHDNLQQMIAMAAMRLNLIRNAVEPQVRPTLEEVQDILSQSIELSRTLAVELAPPILYDAGLVPALRWLGRHYEKIHHLHVAVEASAEPDLPEDLRALLFHSVRELLFNVVKHAGVYHAVMQVRATSDLVGITVIDQGNGSEPGADHKLQHESFGLLSIRERIERLGGRFHFVSEKDRGTTVVIEMPVGQAADPKQTPA